ATTGEVTAQLIPAATGNRNYTVTVAPDPTQLFATSTQPLAVAGAGVGPDIMLPLRTQLSGQVVDVTGKPLDNLMVTPASPTLAATLAATPSTGAATPDMATASSDGRFSVRLDPGLWDVGLVPAADAMLPRLWLTQLPLTADYDVGTVTVKPGVMVHGVVHDPSGAPLPHATVRLYTVSGGNSACATNDDECLAPPRLRAQSTSGSDGIVAVILPSQPTQ
ncbi:MAG TPA: hypothetical protein VGL86_26635, partial [Polyangia bacterium]